AEPLRAVDLDWVRARPVDPGDVEDPQRATLETDERHALVVDVVCSDQVGRHCGYARRLAEEPAHHVHRVTTEVEEAPAARLVRLPEPEAPVFEPPVEGRGVRDA